MIKGLVGKEGNTLGSQVKPWETLFVKQIIGGGRFPINVDSLIPLESFNISKTSSWNYSGIYSNPVPTDGYVRFYINGKSSSSPVVRYGMIRNGVNVVDAITTGSGVDGIDCITFFFGPGKSYGNLFTFPIKKDWRAFGVMSANDYSTAQCYFHDMM